MGTRLFGTDGMRGVAGEYPLDPATVYALGMALGAEAWKIAPAPQILIGMDTRESSPQLAALISGGLACRGVGVRSAGVITTPGLAWLARTGPFCAGVMISASHNPYLDNGIKVFGHSGLKLPDDEERAIEAEIFRLAGAGLRVEPLDVPADAGLDRRYLEFLLSTTAGTLAGQRVVLDCGNGAASHLAPDLFARAGAEATAINHSPDGRNINLESGSLHVEGLRQRVLESRAEFGVAFDGDADRAIFIARSGKIVDGDAVMLIAARALKAAGRLPGDTVVATVMSNLGLELALRRAGIAMTRTPVGDKYVLDEMLRSGAALGGEQSGHVIFREWATTGDGMLTALQVFDICRKAGAGLDELTADLEVCPQKLVNVRVRERRPLAEIPAVADEIRRSEEAFGTSGRVLVRFSGTEPVARVMVEGQDAALVEECAARIARAIERELGMTKGE